MSNTQLKTIENLAEKGEAKAVQIEQFKTEVWCQEIIGILSIEY